MSWVIQPLYELIAHDLLIKLQRGGINNCWAFGGRRIGKTVIRPNNCVLIRGPRSENEIRDVLGGGWIYPMHQVGRGITYDTEVR